MFQILGARVAEAGTGAAGCRSSPASWRIMAEARGALVLDGQQPVAGMGGAPELAHYWGGSRPVTRGGPGSRAAEAGTGAAGCRSCY
ncbi:hypothetical protein ACV1CY_11770 [Aeromonas caviae]